MMRAIRAANYSSLIQIFVVVLCFHGAVSSSEVNCLLGGFYFARGRDVAADHTIEAAAFLNLTVSGPRECFRECSDNCRCISFNFRQHLRTDNCELNDESRHTAPRSLKREEGCDNYDLVVDYSFLKGTDEKCINNCCKTDLCKNGGTCSELCDAASGKRFQCSCAPGYKGPTCEQKEPRTCLDFFQAGKSENDVYTVLDDEYKPLKVYCDLSSEPDFVWTSIQSHSLANKDLFSHHPLFLTDSPINEENPDVESYRMSLSHLRFFRHHTTHWRATCRSRSTEDLRCTDYIRSSFETFDLMSNSSAREGNCQEFDFLSIRGVHCVGCTAATWYGGVNSSSFVIDSSAYKGCWFDARSGAVDSEQNFGVYEFTNPAFCCTANATSTTQFWFGTRVVSH